MYEVEYSDDASGQIWTFRTYKEALEKAANLIPTPGTAPVGWTINVSELETSTPLFEIRDTTELA